MRKLIYIIIPVLVVGAFYLLTRIAEVPDPEKDAPDTFAVSADSTSSASMDSSAADSKSQDTTAATVAAVSANLAELNQWVTSEAPLLNQKGVNPKEKDVELRRKVETFSNDEKNFLMKVAVDTNRAATERILSAYMLSLDPAVDAGSRLAELANQPLQDFGPLNAHSEAELRRNQDLSIRYMAVDQLLERALSGQNEAREELRKLAENGSTAEIRSYAKRNLEQIK